MWDVKHGWLDAANTILPIRNDVLLVQLAGAWPPIVPWYKGASPLLLIGKLLPATPKKINIIAVVGVGSFYKLQSAVNRYAMMRSFLLTSFTWLLPALLYAQADSTPKKDGGKICIPIRW
jgi:hypothetical protein